MTRSARVWWICAAASLFLLGCPEDNEIEPVIDAGPGPEVCTDGDERPCLTEGGCAGSQSCVGGTWEDCEAPAEACDGVDNDCDGTTDEGYAGLGDTCTAGQGACEDAGRIVCTADGTDTECNATPGDGTDEVCDGVDNDCDGEVDDDVPTGVECDTGRLGACSAGTTVCADGDTVCEAMVEATDETCDGIDNDCDGRVDEGENGGALAESCYDGPEGTEGVGLCAAGVRVCTDGAFSDCAEQVLPGDEICDGADNDCDGEVDDVDGVECVCVPGEVQPCYGGPEGTEDIGVCRGGTQLCNEDGTGFGECDNQVMPGVELCDGLDNDCDGEVDDAMGVGDACTVGQGVCAAEGTRVCDLESGQVVCDAEAGLPGDEICNGLDDDCDGMVDDVEGVGEPCQEGEGACLARGVQRCDVATGALACSAEPNPAGDEVCDGIDNDCDGEIDDVPGVGEACAVGEGLCRSTGLTVCDIAAGAVICGATEQDPRREVCDTDLDEDCDGETDEEDCIIPCDVDEDCGPARLCADGACVPGDCRGDEDCDAGELCIDSFCVEGDCRDDGECPDGQICSANTCIDPPQACLDAQAIGFGTVVGSTVDAGDDFEGSCAANTADVVFRLDPAGYAGPVCATTDGSAYDTKLFARSACARADTELDCDDDGGVGTDSQITFDVQGDASVYVFVDGFNGASGDFVLTVTQGPCACRTADDCAEGQACRLGACLVPVCGDGVVDDAEACDDGNTASGDGCDDTCQIEFGYTCETAGGPCAEVPGLYQGVDRVPGEALPGFAFAEMGEAFENACPGDQVIRGAEANIGALGPVSMRALCGAIVVGGDRLVVDPGGTTARVGDDAAPLDTRIVCPPHHAVVGYVAYQPGGLSLLCSPVRLVAGRLDFGAPVESDPIGLALVEIAREQCAAGTAAAAHTGAADDAAVYAFGLRCDDFVDQCEGGSVCEPIGECFEDADCEGGEVCADFQCVGPEVCDDGVGNNGNDLVDCFDAAFCGDHPACTAGACEVDDDCGGQPCVGGVCGVDPGAPIAIAQPGHAVATFGVVDAEDPVFVRANQNCTRRNPDADFFFDTRTIVNATGAQQQVTLDASWAGYDGYLNVFAEPFDPAGVPEGCITGDDDFNGTAQSQVVDLNLAPGEQVVVVLTTFGANNAGGPFTLRVSTQAPDEACDDGFDNDDDGLFDCEDPDCALAAACAECGDGIVQAGEACDDGNLEPNDGCSPTCEIEVEVCDDGVDNDGDDAIDCDDADCARDPACAEPEVCDDGIDNDLDDLTDCEDEEDCADDPACQAAPVCAEEGFEAPDLPAGFATEGNAPWFIDGESFFEGAAAASSGDIADSQVSVLSTVVSVPAGGTVRFAYRVSSEGGFDFLRFVVDGEQLGSWSNVPDWAEAAFDLPPGDHRLEWRYTKDGSVSSGEDRAQIDALRIESLEACAIGVAAPDEICDDGGDNDGDGDVDCEDADCAGDPACAPACVPDPFEGDFEDPGVLEPGVYEGLTLCPGDVTPDVDGFRVPVCPGGTVQVFVSADPAADFTLAVGFDEEALPRVQIPSDGGVAFSEVTNDIGAPDAEFVVSGRPGLVYDVTVDVIDCDGEPEICDDGVDNDGDGDVDCEDAACADDPACAPVVACDSEGFEGLDLPDGFFTDGDAPWFIDGESFFEGAASASSGDIGNNQASSLSTIVSVPAGGTVRFAYRVSSEANFDFLRFFVDGEQLGSWSSVPGWAEAAFPLAPGDHLLEWRYTKDGSASVGEDRAQIDALRIESDGLCAIGVPPPAEVCDDGADNDLDGDADCDDEDCADDPACAVQPEVCDDGIDNDRDGAVDCADIDCADDPACPFVDGDLRLVEGDALSGRLEVFFRGQWGTVCDDLWDGAQGLTNADVACRQLGFRGAAAVDLQAPAGVDPIWLDNVACLGGEARLADCPANAIGNENCDHLEDVGVRCLAPGECRVDAHCDPGESCVEGACAVLLPELCDDGIDNDGDGDIDCADADCAFDLACALPEICDDGIDNDLDLFVDCADPDCVDDPACAPAPVCADEGFEGPDLPAGFLSDGAAPWFIDGESFFEGAGAASSGDIGDNQFSSLRTSLSLPAGGTLRFRYRVSSEGGFDFLRFIVNGAELRRWSNVPGWAEASFDLPAGDHIVEWRYTKDGSATVGEDRAQIDALVIEADDCVLAGGVVGAEVCDDGADNDLDGAIDCEDGDCDLDPACVILEICDSGIDDDGDGLLDCADDECDLDPACAPTAECAFDFEAAGVAAPFGSRGDAIWFADAGALSSGDISDLQQSVLSLAKDLPTGGAVRFSYRVSSEPNFDFLEFYVDGVRVERWSGEVDWTPVEYPLDPGLHLLEWRYFKDGSASRGEDRGLIDDLAFIADDVCPAGDVEVCDDGLDNDGDGDVDCADADCVDDVACVVDPEVCDDGLDNDGDGAEDCDDPDCAFAPECAPGPGDLVITEIMKDPAVVLDNNGEWFELYNGGAVAVDLEGWTVGEDPQAAEGFTIEQPLVIEPGQYMVFARIGDPAVNGGVAVDYAYGINYNLANGADEIIMRDPDGVERVGVRYDNGALWPDPNGASLNFDSRIDPTTANNADPANWCEATSRYEANNLGTPGAPNDPCGPIEEAVDFCRLQFPAEIDGVEGEAVTVYGRLYEAGLTDRSPQTDIDAAVLAQVGYLADGDDPADPQAWVWTDAEANAAYDGGAAGAPDEDEYQADLVLPAEGIYNYAYRFSVDAGLSWQLCDLDGAGANPDAGDFALGNSGVMLTSAPAPDFCPQACAEAAACGLLFLLPVLPPIQNEADCVTRCQAGEVTQAQAQCVAETLDPPDQCEANTLLPCL